MRPRSILLTTLALLASTAGFVRAQSTTFPFQIIVTTNSTSSTLANGGQISFNAPVNQTQTATVTATYQGTGQVTISQAPNVLGSTSFQNPYPTLSFVGQPLQKLPYLLNPGDSITLSIAFDPSSAQEVSATLVQNFSETAPSSTGTLQTTQNSITLVLVGTAPNFVFSYTIPASTGNATQVQNGGTIPFPPTLINTNVLGLFTITDNGSGPGTIISITPPAAGSAFQLQGSPLLPGTLSNTTQPLSVGILYTPSGNGTDTGQIQVTYGTGSGTTVTFNLTGSSSASTYTYSVIQSGMPNVSVTPGGTITLPNTNIGTSSTLIVKVMNSGSASGTVNSVNVTPTPPFAVSGTPQFPEPLASNAAFTFQLTFTPTQPGPATGELLVGSDMFTLSGQGIGPQLAFSYQSAGTTQQVSTTISFSPVQVTQSEQLMVVITNTGTSPATVSNISIGESPSPFSIAGPLALPTTINPSGTFSFNVIFTPTTEAFVQGTLHIDGTVIAVGGTGEAPPSLPPYTFTGQPSGNVNPQSQPEIGLTLSAPYPVDLTGTLTLTTSGTLPTDPAAQFITGSSTGNRTVDFVIPANTTSANFAGQGSEIFLQTGTVAETITLTPSFETEAGGINLTPASPAFAQLVVPAAAPTLIGIEIASTTTNGFTLVITGYSTTRSLTSLNVTFSAAAGFSLPTVPPIDLTQVAPSWFQSTSAQSFGGQFAITIPFTLQGTVSTGQTLLQAITAVSANVSNALGTSNSLEATVQ